MAPKLLMVQQSLPQCSTNQPSIYTQATTITKSTNHKGTHNKYHNQTINCDIFKETYIGNHHAKHKATTTNHPEANSTSILLTQTTRGSTL